MNFFALRVLAAISALFLVTPLGFALNNLPPATETRTANIGPGCNLEITMSPNANLAVAYSAEAGKGGATIHLTSLPKGYAISELYITFVCFPYDGVADGSPVRLDEAKHEWVRDFPNRIQFPNSGGDEENQARLNRAINFYPSFSSANAIGFAYTEDDITGDRRGRKRIFSFCLMNPPKAVCGQDLTAYLYSLPRYDTTPYVLKIVRSLKFLPDSEPDPATVAH